MMPQQRKTIPVATSAFLFVCLMLHAQAGFSAQTFAPYNDVEAYNAHQSLIPNGWTATVARARRFIIRAQTGGYPVVVSSYVSSPIALSADRTIFQRIETDGVWKNISWMGTSRAWAS